MVLPMRVKRTKKKYLDDVFLHNLRELCRKRKPGTTLNSYQIAKRCGVTPPFIDLVTRSGLRKMRNRLPPEVRASFEELLAKHRTTPKPIWD